LEVFSLVPKLQLGNEENHEKENYGDFMKKIVFARRIIPQKGVKIGWGEYMKVGLVITPPVLLVVLIGLL
jgi:hypothetical protein